MRDERLTPLQPDEETKPYKPIPDQIYSSDTIKSDWGRDNSPNSGFEAVVVPDDELFHGDNYEEVENFLNRQIHDYKPETSEETEKRERSEKQLGFLARVADGLGTFHTAYSHARGVKPMDMPKMSAKATERYERAKAAREADKDRYFNYAFKLGQIRENEDKDRRAFEEQKQRMRLADEKDKREQEKQGWLKKLQPDKEREQKNKADKAGNDAETSRIVSLWAPKKEEQEYENIKKKGVLLGAQTNNANAGARAHDRSNPSPFRAYDKNGKAHHFPNEASAILFATQEGTLGSTSTTSSSRSVGSSGVTKTTKTTQKNYALKPAPKKNKDKKGVASGLIL